MNPTSTGFGLDQVNVSFLNSAKTLPLIVSPRWEDSLNFLCTWLQHNRAWVEEQILHFGAVLIRGFQVDSAPDFERATLALQPNLCDAYRGTSPRSLKLGTKYAFSAADVPVNYPIAQHCEMSFLKAPPRELYFGCLKESKSLGGETALCDFRRVYQDLSEELRTKFATKKIKYTRKHLKVGETWTYDVGAMLGWPRLFDTSDPKQVEAICREEESPDVQWIGPDHDTFLQEWIDDPFQRHPITNELAWFNHSQVFHWTTFPAELWFAFRRMHNIRLFLHFVLVSIFNIIKYGIFGYKMALNTSFGDGSPITFREMNEIRKAIHKNMVFSRWKKGDILAIDNFSTSHGRQPTYDKGRSVAVAWSQPLDKTKIVAPLAANAVSVQKVDLSALFARDNDLPPGLIAATPNSSPESTLTNEEATDLKESLLKNHALQEQAMAYSKPNRRSKRLASCPDFLQADSKFWKIENN
jgi:hypothetical protein